MNFKNLIKSAVITALFAANTAAAAPVVGNEPEPNFITDSFDAAISGAEVVFPYQSNKIYTVYAQKGFITDIRMQPGETITSVSAGDTERWVIDKAAVGQGFTKVEHLYVKPVYTDIRTNMVINTTVRTYQLNLVSGNFYNPVVTWQLDKKIGSNSGYSSVKNYAAIDPMKLNFAYKFNKKDLPWAPAKVFDDGIKTYIKMKPEVFSNVMPAFFILNDKNDVILTNYRVVKGTYIIDRLFNKAQLVVGKEQITIKREGA
jgi:P-type conjugative transfer protein TrbG